jgi:hypothetical protein
LVNNETGIGWDESGKNIVMTDAWWKKIVRVSAIDVAFQYCLSILIENLVTIDCLCFCHIFKLLRDVARSRTKDSNMRTS